MNAAIPSAAKTCFLPERVDNAITGIFGIDPLTDGRWQGLLQRHTRASVFHSTNWLRVLRSVYDYKPVAFTTCSSGIPLTNGLVMCGVRSWLTGRRLVSLPFSDHCEPLLDDPNELDRLLSNIRQQVDNREWNYLEIRPLAHEPRATQLARNTVYCVHRLDLRKSIQEIFCGFHKDCVQRKIRRAEREKLVYEEGTSEELLRKFYRLVVMTRRRQYLPPQPLKWFQGLLAAFGKDLKIRVASKEGLAIASILTLSHKKSMIYKYGASDALYSKFGGMALLLWNTIQDAREHGFEELDMGRSDVGNVGLIAFKDHWGASRKFMSSWTYPLTSPGLPGVWKKRLGKLVVPRAPDLALETIGNLFYRHIG